MQSAPTRPTSTKMKLWSPLRYDLISLAAVALSIEPLEQPSKTPSNKMLAFLMHSPLKKLCGAITGLLCRPPAVLAFSHANAACSAKVISWNRKRELLGTKVNMVHTALQLSA